MINESLSPTGRNKVLDPRQSLGFLAFLIFYICLHLPSSLLFFFSRQRRMHQHPGLESMKLCSLDGQTPVFLWLGVISNHTNPIFISTSALFQKPSSWCFYTDVHSFLDPVSFIFWTVLIHVWWSASLSNTFSIYLCLDQSHLLKSVGRYTCLQRPLPLTSTVVWVAWYQQFLLLCSSLSTRKGFLVPYLVFPFWGVSPYCL